MIILQFITYLLFVIYHSVTLIHYTNVYSFIPGHSTNLVFIQLSCLVYILLSLFQNFNRFNYNPTIHFQDHFYTVQFVYFYYGVHTSRVVIVFPTSLLSLYFLNIISVNIAGNLPLHTTTTQVTEELFKLGYSKQSLNGCL